mmetsp:Transcript_14311/g.44268  ORF Transcript_14311/g.44268 Transcript_14311/m.44268 type:complete len:284 (+) Transcript_14311:742-1593(+)
MQLVMLGNYLYMLLFSLAVQPRVACEREIPLATHLRLVVAAYAYYQGQNLAFALGMPMHLVLVLKNGGLLSQLLVGYVLLDEHYSLRQVLAALVVTAGIVVALYDQLRNAEAGGDAAYLPTGVLVGAMLFRSLGNEWTKRAFAAHGRHYNEVLFYQHFLGLPVVLASWRALLNTATAWTALEPRMWFLLAAHLVGNFVCTQAATRVVAASTMALNVVLCVQRFISIALSATALAKEGAAPPGADLWIGAVLVTAGVFAFATAPRRAPSLLAKSSSANSNDEEA